jgi:hypothetical protein
MLQQVRNVADLPVAVEFRWRSSTFCQRLILLAGLMLAEWLPISAAISTGAGDRPRHGA